MPATERATSYYNVVKRHLLMFELRAFHERIPEYFRGDHDTCPRTRRTGNRRRRRKGVHLRNTTSTLARRTEDFVLPHHL